MRKICLFAAFAMFLLTGATALYAADTLDMILVDTEGGKALLIVSPSGESMLIDTGFPPGRNTGSVARDAIRIEEAAKEMGVKQFDWLVTTHYDGDHVYNTTTMMARIPAVNFVDHGAGAQQVLDSPAWMDTLKSYNALWARPNTKHFVVKPGDKIPFKGVDVLVVTSAGEALKTPAPGGGIPNAACVSCTTMVWPRTNEDVSENAMSVGLLFTFGQFRMLDLGDLTWNKELALMCPTNPIGTVDLLMVSHHGNDISNSPALIHAVRPRVTVMDNGLNKIGALSVIQTIQSSPGLQAAYQMHWSARAADQNPPDDFIANIQRSASDSTATDGAWIKVSASKDGIITVTNGRTGGVKTFKR